MNGDMIHFASASHLPPFISGATLLSGDSTFCASRAMRSSALSVSTNRQERPFKAKKDKNRVLWCCSSVQVVPNNQNPAGKVLAGLSETISFSDQDGNDMVHRL